MKNLKHKMISSCLMACNSIGAIQNSEELKSLFNEDAKLLHGEFSNGLTYFIKENPFDAKKASLRLVVNIGSIHEKEEERGFAHFIEHMVFRGSENFKDGEVIKFLEKIGAAFGAHTNAYTSFDETVYMLDIPLDHPDHLDMGLKILSDFAFKAHFGQKELEIEKGVVLDEMRQREAVSFGRLSNLLCEKLLGHTLYGSRLPIGLEPVIQECTTEKMHSFYSTWYQPHNMAIIAVGDFSGKDVLAILEKYFENIKSELSPSVFTLPLVSNTPQDVAVLQNPDNMGSIIFFSSWIGNEDRSSVQGYKNSLTDQLVAFMVNRRFGILAEQESAPFSYAYMIYPNFIKPKRSLMIRASCWDKRPEDAVDGVISELLKIKQLSFDAQELEIAKNTYKSNLAQMLQNAQSQLNARLAQSFIQAFKFDHTALSTEDAAKLESMLLDLITLEDVNQKKDSLITPELLSVTYFPSENANPMGSEQILKIIEKISSKEFFNDEQEKKSWDLFVKEKPGDIKATKHATSTQVEEIELSNHMKVFLLPSSVKKNMLHVYLKAEGGLDHTTEDVFPSAKQAMGYLARSGLYGFSATELSDVLAGKNVKFFYNSLFDRTVTAETSKEDMLHLFKLIHGLFTARNTSERSWKQSIEEKDQLLALKKTNSELQFYQLQNDHNYSNHYAFKLHDSKEMEQSKAQMYLDKAFSNPSDYTMIIVGDYEKKALLEALKIYIASIPCQGQFLEKEFSEFEFPGNITEVSVESASLKDESTFVMTFPLKTENFTPKFESYFYLELLKNLLTRRCLETLRMLEGQTYGVFISSFFPFYPNPQSGRLIVNFSCQKDKEQFMKNLMLEQIKKAQASCFSQEELDKAFEIYKHQYAKSLLTLEGLKEKVEQNSLFHQTFDFFIQDQVLEVKPTAQKLQTILCDLVDLDHYSVCARRPMSN